MMFKSPLIIIIFFLDTPLPTLYFYQLSKPKHIIARLTSLYICARIIDIYSMKGFTPNVLIHAGSTSKKCF